MKSLINKIIIGAVGLALATAPLAASAQSWQGHGSDNRGGWGRARERRLHPTGVPGTRGRLFRLGPGRIPGLLLER